MNILATISGLLNEKTATAVLMIGIIFNGHQIQETNTALMQVINGAETNYALNVIEYGLKGKTEDKDIYDQIAVWHEDDWGAQIGAIITLCESEPNRLEELVSAETTKAICRLTKNG